MIITQKKPLEELLGMLDGAKTVALVGCGSCATACATGGEKEIAELSKVLEQHGMKVVATAMSEYCCMHLKTRTILKPVIAANPDAVVAMSCGDGVQVIAQYCKRRPATCAATACWARPAASVPSPAAPRAWSTAPAAAPATASAK